MHSRHAFLAAALCLTLQPLGFAQPPAAPPAGGPPQQGGARTPEKPKNLQVLPENADLRKIMHQYEADLGVECEYCHYKPVGARRPDFASDANPMKDVARYMIKMNDDVNSKYLTMLPKGVKDVDADAKVDCGTCHRGHAKPEAFVAPKRQEHEHMNMNNMNMDHDHPGMAPGGAAPAPETH